LRL
jgi:hypothetical protein